MLNQRICEAYTDGVTTLHSMPEVTTLAAGKATDTSAGYQARAQVARTTAKDFIAQTALREEIFGPASLLVVCQDSNELLAAIACLTGQLTGTVHATPKELADYPGLTELLRTRVGRLVFNGFPTGVEVCPSMVHGGPFPASTDARFTSVGTAAIQRFLRPVCYQDAPEAVLPDALKDHNPLGIMRLVNGQTTRDTVKT